MDDRNRRNASLDEAAELTDIEKTILNAKNGDPDAISLLYELAYSKVYYTVRSMIQDEDAVFDIVQNTFIKAFTHLDKFDGSDRFIPWMKQIAVNASKDWLKKKNPLLFSELQSEEDTLFEEQLVDDKPENLPEQVLDREETARLIREILQELPEDQRAVIGMYYYEEFSVKKIAQLMDITESAVKSRLLYGRRKIEKKVRELEKQGTKLYNLAPVAFLLWLFRSERSYAAVPPDERICKAILEQIPRSKPIQAENTAGAKARAARSGLTFGGASAAKLGLAAVAAAVFAGGSIFGIFALKNDSKIPETIPLEENAEIADLETDGFREAYARLIESADSLDYDCTEASPTGKYSYALVTLRQEDEIPALLISQEADNYMEYVRVFQYDADSGTVLQPSDVLLMGVGSAGYRGGLSTGEGQTQLQLTNISAGTGALTVYRILAEKDSLVYELAAEGRLDQEIPGITYEEIQWFDTKDKAGLAFTCE